MQRKYNNKEREILAFVRLHKNAWYGISKHQNGSHPSRQLIRADITTQSVIYKMCSQPHTPSHICLLRRAASLVER